MNKGNTLTEIVFGYFIIGASLGTQMVKNQPVVQETGFHPWVGKIPGEQNGNPHQHSYLENSMEPGGLQPVGSQRVRHD